MKWRTLVIFSAVLFLLPACKGKEAEAAGKSGKDNDLIVIESDKESIRLRNPEDVAQAIEKQAQEMEKGAGKAPVDFQKLKELLPSRLGWFVRREHKGQRTAVAGFGASSAEATYVSGNAEFRIQISDPGVAGSLIGMFSELANVEIDNTTEDGFERTTTINGFKAMEKFEKTTGHGELTIFAGGRFVVSMEGDNLKPNTLRNAAEKLDLKKLAKLGM